MTLRPTSRSRRPDGVTNGCVAVACSGAGARAGAPAADGPSAASAATQARAAATRAVDELEHAAGTPTSVRTRRAYGVLASDGASPRQGRARPRAPLPRAVGQPSVEPHPPPRPPPGAAPEP